MIWLLLVVLLAGCASAKPYDCSFQIKDVQLDCTCQKQDEVIVVKACR